MVRKYSAVPFEEIRLVQNISDFQLPQVRRGIVFVFAAWSGHAVLSLQRLTHWLVAHGLPLELIVVDIESMTTQEMNQWFGREFHGHGETLWLRDGKIVASLEAPGPESELAVLNYSRQLLVERAC